MVVRTERNDMTRHEYEGCGLMFDEQEDAGQHDTNCDAEESSYIQ